MKHEGITLGQEPALYFGMLSTVNGFRSGEKQMLLVDTDGGESASGP